jgi:hypothetical protein
MYSAGQGAHIAMPVAGTVRHKEARNVIDIGEAPSLYRFTYAGKPQKRCKRHKCTR